MLSNHMLVFDFLIQRFCQSLKIAKVDIATRTHLEWYQENCYPSEPVFVASPGAVEEDDGEDVVIL